MSTLATIRAGVARVTLGPRVALRAGVAFGARVALRTRTARGARFPSLASLTVARVGGRRDFRVVQSAILIRIHPGRDPGPARKQEREASATIGLSDGRASAPGRAPNFRQG
jgi:hypothetical protein